VKQKLISILLVLSLPIVLCFRACSIVGFHFRFGEIRTFILGHFVFDIEYYLRKRSLNGSDSTDLFFIVGDVSNSQWLRMVKRKVFVSPLVKVLFKANRLLPNYQKYEIEKIPKTVNSPVYDEIFASTKLQLRFTQQENNQGQKYLRCLGFEPNDKFVCLVVRDKAYKNALSKDKDWSYHNYRDSDINSYSEMATVLAEKGYWVFRMGKVVDKPLAVAHTRIIDYASSQERSDFLDVWLSARCSICITTGTGLDEISGIHGIPSVFVNLLPLTHVPLYKFSLTVPKKLLWRETGNLLNINEYMRHAYISTDDYQAQGIDIVDLTPKEITEAVMEMDLTIKGQTQLSTIQLQRQEQIIQKIFELDKMNCRSIQNFRDTRARLGSNFLEKYWDKLMV